MTVNVVEKIDVNSLKWAMGSKSHEVNAWIENERGRIFVHKKIFSESEIYSTIGIYYKDGDGGIKIGYLGFVINCDNQEINFFDKNEPQNFQNFFSNDNWLDIIIEKSGINKEWLHDAITKKDDPEKLKWTMNNIPTWTNSNSQKKAAFIKRAVSTFGNRTYYLFLSPTKSGELDLYVEIYDEVLKKSYYPGSEGYEDKIKESFYNFDLFLECQKSLFLNIS